MRTIRTVFLIVLAVVLVVLAFANRQLVTLSLKFTDYLPGFSVRLPLFLIVLLVLMIGILIGLFWEWLREAGMRAESARRAHEIAQLEREIKGLRQEHAAPADEVVAILDVPTRRRPDEPIQPVGPAIASKG